MSKSLYGAEILAVGTWNGITFTGENLDGIATAFEALGLNGRVPLKFGHNDEQPLTDGQPALGWVSRVYRSGDKLLADFTDMPTSVYELIRSGRYKFISVELLRDVQAGTRKLPWVLDAVALLGADQPAVGTLQDLQSLTLKRRPALQARARVAFKRDFSTNPGAPKGMEKHEVEALLKQQKEELTASFTSQLNTLKTENAQALEAERAKTRTAEVSRHRDAIKSKFETAVKAEQIKPAVREQFYRLTRIDTDAVMEIKAEDADAYIAEHTDKTKLSRDPSTKQGDDGKDEEGLRADQIVSKRAEKLCYSRQQDPQKGDHYFRAVQEVLRTDAKLAEAYKYMPDTEYRQAS